MMGTLQFFLDLKLELFYLSSKYFLRKKKYLWVMVQWLRELAAFLILGSVPSTHKAIYTCLSISSLEDLMLSFVLGHLTRV